MTVTRRVDRHGGPPAVPAAGAAAELRLRLADSEARLSHAAWLIELMTTVSEARRLDEAASAVAGQLKDRLRLKDVVIVWRNRGSFVAAVSDVLRPDPDSDRVREWLSAADEAMLRHDDDPTEPPVYPVGDDGRSEGFVLIAGDAVRGVLLPSTPGDRPLEPMARATMAAAAEPIAAVLASAAAREGGRLKRAARAVLHSTPSTHIAVAGALGLAAAAALVPVPYRVAAAATVRPVEQRYCVAPHDGLLAETTVRPGDLVRAGDVIARMDPREVRAELRRLTADRSQVARRRDGHLAAGETRQAIEAGHRIESLDRQIELFESRRDALTVTAPSAGLVIGGDPAGRRGVPVRAGEILAEVAPLDRVRIELSIAPEDRGRVDVGGTVTVCPDGWDGRTVAAVIERIRPAAETDATGTHFVAECVVDNPGGRLRPGTPAAARIDAGRGSILWQTTRRAATRLHRDWGWW